MAGTSRPTSCARRSQLRFARYDKGGEETYNILSAFHKSLRGSDPQAALYWMARMIEGGQDPMVIFRRAIAMAAEDIGLADPEALKLAVAARDAYHMLGAPEGYLPMPQMVDLSRDGAEVEQRQGGAGRGAARPRRSIPPPQVPLHVRNAPTKLMKELGYHEGYQYAHAVPEAYIPQEYLPEALAGSAFYDARTIRLREGDREAARLVGGASRQSAGRADTRGRPGTVNGGDDRCVV